MKPCRRHGKRRRALARFVTCATSAKGVAHVGDLITRHERYLRRALNLQHGGGTSPGRARIPPVTRPSRN